MDFIEEAEEKKPELNMRVEYDIVPIAAVAVECPNCKNWFAARAIVNPKAFKALRYISDLKYASYQCPVCGLWFYAQDYTLSVSEHQHESEVYEGCLRKKEVKKEVWE